MRPEPLFLALIALLGSDNYHTRENANRILTATPQARLAVVCLMGRDAETYTRGSKLLHHWADADAPHPKAGWPYVARSRGYYYPAGPLIVDVANIEGDWAAIVVRGGSPCYLEWMQVCGWEWAPVPVR